MLTREDWRDQVTQACGGGKVDIVFDPIGGEATEEAFRTLAYGGRHLVVGFPGGIAKLPTNLPLLKSASLIGVNLQQQSLNDPARAEKNSRQVARLGAQGQLHPPVARIYPLDDWAAALAAVERGDQAGRIVVSMK